MRFHFFDVLLGTNIAHAQFAIQLANGNTGVFENPWPYFNSPPSVCAPDAAASHQHSLAEIAPHYRSAGEPSLGRCDTGVFRLDYIIIYSALLEHVHGLWLCTRESIL